MTNISMLRCLAFAILAASTMGAVVGCAEGTGLETTPSAISVVLSSSEASVVQGGSATVTATVTRSGSFTGTVNLSIEGIPAGVTGTVSDVQTTDDVTTATVTINVDASVVPGSYDITLRGSGSGVTDVTVNFTLTVTAAPSYDLALSPDEVSIVQGGGGTIQVTLARTNFAGAVDLSIEGAPAGVIAAFDPTTALGAASTLALTVGAATAVGEHTLTVRGVANGLTDRTATLTLTVTGTDPVISWTPAAMTFSGLAGGSNPANQTLEINNSGGGTLSWTVNDDAGWLSLSPGSGSSTGETDEVTVSVNTSGLAVGTYTATVTIAATGATNTPQTVAVTLTVTEPGSSMGDDATVIFLHHSTGNNIWNGGVPQAIAAYNVSQSKSYQIAERPYPSARGYGWANYPYDYWNIWVNHAADDPYITEPNLSSLTQDNDVIVWKHCYPVSFVVAPNGNPDVSSPIKTDANYRLQYEALKAKMHEYPDNRFIVWTGAANVAGGTNPNDATRARSFFQWVVNEWDEPGDNIFIWDFWQLETEGGIYLLNEYAVGPSNSHPNPTFSAMVAPYFAQRVIDVIEGRGDTGSITGN